MKKEQYVVEQLPDDGRWVYARRLARMYDDLHYDTKEEAERAMAKAEQDHYRHQVVPKKVEKMVTKALRKKTVGNPVGSLLGLGGDILIGGVKEHWMYYYFGENDHWFALSGPCGTLYVNAWYWDWKAAPGKVPCKATVKYAEPDVAVQKENNAAGALARPKLWSWMKQPEVVAVVNALYRRLCAEGKQTENQPESGEKQC